MSSQWKILDVGELANTRTSSVDPTKFPDEVFDLYSIPSYDNGEPEVLCGKDIGSSKKAVNPGDILISKIVPHIRRVWIVGPNRGRRQIASSEWISFSGENILPEYLRYYLLSDMFHAKFMSTITGVGGSLLRARPSEVYKIEIPVPPLETQKHIAQVLEQADQLRKQARQMEDELNQLAQSVFLEMFGDPKINPKEWPVRLIGELATVETGSTPSRSNESYYGGEIPWVKTGEVSGSYIYQAEEHITTNAIKKTNCKIFPTDTVLVAMYGQGKTRGKAGILKVPAATNQACAAILPPDSLLPEFILDYLKLRYLALRALGRGGNQENLNLKIIKEFPIYVPPLGAQQEYLDMKFQLNKALESNQRQTTLVNDLFESLMQRAFKGELTEPDTRAA